MGSPQRSLLVIKEQGHHTIFTRVRLGRNAYNHRQKLGYPLGTYGTGLWRPGAYTIYPPTKAHRLSAERIVN